MLNLEKHAKDEFIEIENEGLSQFGCTCCSADLSESMMYVYKDEAVKSELEFIFDTESPKGLTDRDLEEYPTITGEIYDAEILCYSCYNKVGVKNSKPYEVFLDIIFDGFEHSSNCYRSEMSEHQPKVNSGSARVMNEIINSIYRPDYFDVKINELGEFDLKNYAFVCEILKVYGGVDIEAMKEANAKKNDMIIELKS